MADLFGSGSPDMGGVALSRGSKGVATARKSRQHVARFLLVGLYTGTRSGRHLRRGAATAGRQGLRRSQRGRVLSEGARRRGDEQAPANNSHSLIDSLLTCGAGATRAFRAKPSSSSRASPSPASRKRSRERRLTRQSKASRPMSCAILPITWAMQDGADPYAASDLFGRHPRRDRADPMAIITRTISKRCRAMR